MKDHQGQEVEKDPEKFFKLTQRIIQPFDSKEGRLRRGDGNQPKDNQIFQIAYDEMLLLTRTELLKHRGYEVSSVLGNDAAKRVLDGHQSYRLFIVGHSAPTGSSVEMIRWLKAKFPGTKILALNPPYHTNSEADYNYFILEDPEEWLEAVASATGRYPSAP